MGTERGENFARLIADLEENASSYSVFYAIYLGEKLLKKMHSEQDSKMLEQDRLEFRPYEHYVFPTRNIRDFRYENEVMKFVLNFLGLYGNNAPLPRCYHEQVSIQQSIHGRGDVPLQNFLDIFNNRFYWLYYQAWKKYRYFLHLSEDPDNKAMQQVFSFIGQGPQFNKNALPVSRYKLLQLSGILSHRVRSKVGLLIMLREYFPRFKIDVQEFVPCKVEVNERPRMGRQYDEHAFRLGTNGLVGRSVMDCMSRICLIVGPLDFDGYLEFLPRGKSADLLRYLLNLYLNDGLEYDVKLILETDSIGKISWNDKRVKLGLSFWLGKPKQPYIDIYLKYEKYSQAS